MFILLPAVVGASLYKDYKSQAHQIIYSFPITRGPYLLSKVTASLFILFCLSLLVILGWMGAEQLEGLNPNLKGPFNPGAYLQTFLWYIVPNWIGFGFMTFAMVMQTRKIIPAYLVVVLPFLIQLIAENAFVGNDYLLGLFDPFGQNVASFYQRDWDIAARNTNVLPVGSLLISNRILWLSVSFLYFLKAYLNFHFVEETERRKIWQSRSYRPEVRSETYLITSAGVLIKEFGFRMYLLALLRTAVKSFKRILSNPMFWVISLSGLVAAVFIMIRVTVLEDFVLVPATQIMTGTPLLIYSMVIVLVIFIYSGMLVHQESIAGMSQLLASAPVPGALFLLGKMVGTFALLLLMLVMFIATGIVFQCFSGYANYEVGLYSYTVLMRPFVPLVSWMFVSYFVHIVVGNLYMSIFILLVGWIGVQGLPTVGITSYLLRFNDFPRSLYSAFNGFGYLESAFFLVVLYWFAIAALFMLFAIFIYHLSDNISWKDRWNSFIYQMLWKYLALVATPLVVIIIWAGTRIYDGETKLYSAEKQRIEFGKFRSDFQRFVSLPQPQIVSLVANIDLYPSDQSFECQGYYSMVNRSVRSLDTLLIRSGFDEVTELNIGVPYKILLTNDYMKVTLVKLERSLLPGDSLQLSFKIRSDSNSLFERNSNVLSNGTYLRQDIFPRLGYRLNEELPDPSDSLAGEFHYQSLDSDKLTMDLTIGTSSSQIAVAPGDLIQHWNKNGRSYYRYRTDPMKFVLGINSASYKTQTIENGNRKYELYYLHSGMLTSMVEGVESAISIGEKLFGEFPYEVVRVVEFPITEGTYATNYGNNVLVSEARFLANKTENDAKVDIGFYVTAHETLHFWWGNKVMPAHSNGATMLTESITEYIMLRLLQEYKGEQAMNDFYELQSERYKSGKRAFKGEEPPLMLATPAQQFITYGKGATSLFDFSEAIGKDRFHNLLSRFMMHYENGERYPTSLDFIEFLKDHLDDNEDELVVKLFEKI